MVAVLLHTFGMTSFIVEPPKRLTWTELGSGSIELWQDAPFAFSVRRLHNGVEDPDLREMRTTETAARSLFERKQELCTL